MRRATLASLAVVAVLAIGCAGARHTGTSTGAVTTNPTALTHTSWASVSYPFDCSPVGYLVLRTRYADLNGDGRLDAVVLVRCNAGAGDPPVGLFAFDGASSPSKPRLMATLLSPDTDRLATDFVVNGTTVTMDAYGYSSDRVPRCCPDQKFLMTWRWHGSTYSSTTRLTP